MALAKGRFLDENERVGEWIPRQKTCQSGQQNRSHAKLLGHRTKRKLASFGKTLRGHSPTPPPPPPSSSLLLPSTSSLDFLLLFFLLFFLCFFLPPPLPAADSVDPSPADILRSADLKSSISRQTSSSHAWSSNVRGDDCTCSMVRSVLTQKQSTWRLACSAASDAARFVRLYSTSRRWFRAERLSLFHHTPGVRFLRPSSPPARPIKPRHFPTNDTRALKLETDLPSLSQSPLSVIFFGYLTVDAGVCRMGTM